MSTSALPERTFDLILACGHIMRVTTYHGDRPSAEQVCKDCLASGSDEVVRPVRSLVEVASPW